MNDYITLMRSMFLFYLVAFLVLSIGTIFIETPLWFTYLKAVVSIVNFIAIFTFNKAINILSDED